MLVVAFLVAPDGPPRNVKAINRTRDSITIFWVDVENNLLNGDLQWYEIFWKEVASNVSDSVIVERDESKRRKKRSVNNLATIEGNTYKITNLTVYTNYSVKIAAYTIALGPYSNETYLMSGEGGR